MNNYKIGSLDDPDFKEIWHELSKLPEQDVTEFAKLLNEELLRSKAMQEEEKGAEKRAQMMNSIGETNRYMNAWYKCAGSVYMYIMMDVYIIDSDFNEIPENKDDYEHIINVMMWRALEDDGKTYINECRETINSDGFWNEIKECWLNR